MTVTICVPVWNGEAFVEETLESARTQTHEDISVLISVDRSDDRSAEICRAFAARDSRFQVFEQPDRLGWVDNVNWLLRRVPTEVANILPHDDLIAPAYVERLLAKLEASPDAVLAFSDIETFGRRSLVRAGQEATGDLFTRIVDFLSTIVDAVAWRGVFRTRVLEGGCHLEAVNGAAADQVWLLRLAIAGSLVRVPEVLYRKRLHDQSVVFHALKEGMPVDSHWVDHCVSCHRIALAADQWTPEQKQVIGAAVLLRVLRLPNLRRPRSTASEVAASLLALATDYASRLSNVAPPGSVPMTAVDVPDRMSALLAKALVDLRDSASHRSPWSPSAEAQSSRPQRWR